MGEKLAVESAHRLVAALEEKSGPQSVVVSGYQLVHQSVAETVYQSVVALENQSLVAELDKQSVVASEQR